MSALPVGTASATVDLGLPGTATSVNVLDLPLRGTAKVSWTGGGRSATFEGELVLESLLQDARLVSLAQQVGAGDRRAASSRPGSRTARALSSILQRSASPSSISSPAACACPRSCPCATSFCASQRRLQPRSGAGGVSGGGREAVWTGSGRHQVAAPTRGNLGCDRHGIPVRGCPRGTRHGGGRAQQAAGCHAALPAEGVGRRDHGSTVWLRHRAGRHLRAERERSGRDASTATSRGAPSAVAARRRDSTR